MLILTRKIGESLFIGDMRITITNIKGRHVAVGIEAPKETLILREELRDSLNNNSQLQESKHVA